MRLRRTIDRCLRAVGVLEVASAASAENQDADEERGAHETRLAPLTGRGQHNPSDCNERTR